MAKTPIDPARAAFVKRAFAYQTAENTAIKQRYTDAKQIILDTNLTAADAQALGNAYFVSFSGSSIGYTLEIEGVVDLSDFSGGVPRYLLSQDRYPDTDKPFSVVGCLIDYEANRTSIIVRASR